MSIRREKKNSGFFFSRKRGGQAWVEGEVIGRIVIILWQGMSGTYRKARQVNG